MRAISTMLIALVITATNALAAGGTAEGEVLGVGAMCFIGLGVLIILFQFVPAVVLLVGLLKGLLASRETEAHETPLDN